LRQRGKGEKIITGNCLSPDELKGSQTEKKMRLGIGQIQPKKGLPLERRRCCGIVSNQVILFTASQRPRISHNRLKTAKNTLTGKIGLWTRCMVNAGTKRLGRGGEEVGGRKCVIKRKDGRVARREARQPVFILAEVLEVGRRAARRVARRAPCPKR